MVVYELIEQRASKGIVHDYYTAQNSTQNKNYKENPYMYDILMDMIEADPILFRAVDLTTSLITYKGYDFVGEDEAEIEKAKEMFNHTLDFDKVIKNVIFQLIPMGDAYLELRWNDSHTEIKEISARDTQDMKKDFDKHGDIKKYVEVVRGKGIKDEIFYEPDEMISFSLFLIGSSPYSRCPLKAAAKGFATRIHGNDYLQSIFRNLPPKLVHFLKGANEKQLQDFIENLRRAKTNANMDLIVQSNDSYESKVNQVTFDSGLMQVLEYLRKEVLIITGVPAHWVGLMDGVNRGIGENITIPYESKIKGIQHEVASQINRELMEKLGFKKTKFKWNAMSLLNEKAILDNMQVLSAMRFDDETIIDYGKEHGLNLRLGAEIKEPEVPAFGGPQIQDDSAPSRKRSSPGDPMTSNLNKNGVSEEGGKKLKEKQKGAVA